jgi:transposase
MVSMEKKEKRSRRKFTAEYKQRAIDLVLKQGVTVAQAATDLGIYESSLARWVKQARIDQGKGPPGALTTEEREELARLRKENRILKEEREILKKAAAFFAKENR